jgi:hypothetical protein
MAIVIRSPPYIGVLLAGAQAFSHYPLWCPIVRDKLAAHWGLDTSIANCGAHSLTDAAAEIIAHSKFSDACVLDSRVGLRTTSF